jgi:hypothetical protein
MTDKFGKTQYHSGFNFFCALTTMLLDMSKAQVDSAPSTAAPGAMAAVVGTPGAGQISAAFTAAGGTATTNDLWGVGPHSAGRAVTLAQAKHLSYGPAETSPMVKTGLAAGLWTFWIRHVDEATGQVGPFTQFSATLT